MHKLKIAVTVLLTLALLVAGAFIPKLVSAVWDLRSTGTVDSVPITAVELKITKNISSLGRLAMVCNMEGNISLTESKAKMKKEEVLTAVREQLQPYVDAQLMVYAESEVTLNPCLVQVPDMLELQGVVWFVSISGGADHPSAVELMVDDETGHILQLWYTNEEDFDVMPVEDTVMTVADIFFSSLGIDHSGQHLSENMEYAYDGMSGVRRYFFQDPQYGEVFVDFYIYPGGFHTECSKV